MTVRLEKKLTQSSRPTDQLIKPPTVSVSIKHFNSNSCFFRIMEKPIISYDFGHLHQNALHLIDMFWSISISLNSHLLQHFRYSTLSNWIKYSIYLNVIEFPTCSIVQSHVDIFSNGNRKWQIISFSIEHSIVMCTWDIKQQLQLLVHCRCKEHSFFLILLLLSMKRIL